MRACLHHCITNKILVCTTTTSDAKGMDETDSWLPPPKGTDARSWYARLQLLLKKGMDVTDSWLPPPKRY